MIKNTKQPCKCLQEVAGIFIDCKYQKCKSVVCLINIIFGANSNSAKMSSAPANSIVHCEHCKSHTSPQVSSVFNMRACIGFQMGALCEACTVYIPWSMSGCGAAICYSTRDHVAVEVTWQPLVSSLYSNHYVLFRNTDSG